jgi:hypothetical protein
MLCKTKCQFINIKISSGLFLCSNTVYLHTKKYIWSGVIIFILLKVKEML